MFVVVYVVHTLLHYITVLYFALQAPMVQPTMTEVEQYNLALYINETLEATTNVSADTTMVDIFSVFAPSMVDRERYTNYSLRVAAINSAGMGEFSESDVLSE